MLSDELFLMIRLIRKISAITLACLLGLNLAAGAAVVAEPCPSSMCCCDPRDMDHCDGLLNFAFSMQECCGECNDIFCDLTKNPLQDINTVNSSPSQASCYPFLLGTAVPIGESCVQISLSASRYLLPAALVSSQVPLYLEHLCLII